MSELDEKALRDLSGRATAGPWSATSVAGGWDGVKSDRWNSDICHLSENHSVNAAFIAAAVNFVRAYLCASPTPTRDDAIRAIEGPDHVLEIRLCEQNHVVLKPDQLYRFTVDPACPDCRSLKGGKS